MPQNKRRHQEQGRKTPQNRKSLREAENGSDELSLADAKKNIKNLHTDIKSLWNSSQKNRYKTVQTSRGKYKSDRWIWRGALLLILFWLWFIAHSYHYNLDYYKCGDGERLYTGEHQKCKNPFYKSELWWKTQEYLPYGEYGQKPGPLFNSVWYVVFGVLALAGILNHIIHNRRFRR